MCDTAGDKITIPKWQPCRCKKFVITSDYVYLLDFVNVCKIVYHLIENWKVYYLFNQKFRSVIRSFLTKNSKKLLLTETEFLFTSHDTVENCAHLKQTKKLN